jgi:excisionase family DNA binding protein
VSELPVISDEECAELLSCTVGQVRELASCGDLPGAKIGRSWRFLRADVLQWLSDRAKSEAEQRRSRKARREVVQIEARPSRRRAPPSLAYVNQE